MSSDPMLILVVIAMLFVGGVLAVGIGGFAKGGDFNRKYANKIMQLRLAAQAVAVVLILVFIATKGS